MDEKQEPFADSGEFTGAGVTPTGAGPEAEPSNEPGPEPEGKTESPENEKNNPGKSEVEQLPTPPQDDTKEASEKKEPEAKPDPLDLPIDKWEDVDLGLGDVPVDKELIASFGQVAVDLKLSPRQAATLAQFQMKAAEQVRERMGKELFATLRKDWGKDADENQHHVKTLVSNIDAKLGDTSFSDALTESGAIYYPAIAKGLLQVTQLLGEDALGAIKGAPPKETGETALEGLEELFAKARK